MKVTPKLLKELGFRKVPKKELEYSNCVAWEHKHFETTIIELGKQYLLYNYGVRTLEDIIYTILKKMNEK